MKKYNLGIIGARMYGKILIIIVGCIRTKDTGSQLVEHRWHACDQRAIHRDKEKQRACTD
jgi:hypothetical protein